MRETEQMFSVFPVFSFLLWLCTGVCFSSRIQSQYYHSHSKSEHTVLHTKVIQKSPHNFFFFFSSFFFFGFILSRWETFLSTISWFVEQCRYRIMTQQNVLRIESLQQHKNLCVKKSFLKLHMRIKDPPNCWNPVDWQQIQVFPSKRCQENTFSNPDDHRGHKHEGLLIWAEVPKASRMLFSPFTWWIHGQWARVGPPHSSADIYVCV